MYANLMNTCSTLKECFGHFSLLSCTTTQSVIIVYYIFFDYFVDYLRGVLVEVIYKMITKISHVYSRIICKAMIGEIQILHNL
jgi:hypothetical protein